MNAYDINRRLIRLYGRDPILDIPKWRIVRAEKETEKRHGNYNVFYGDIFIRNETGIVETKKYHYLKPCWILEKLCIVVTRNEFTLLGEKSHTYEPFFTFLDKNDKPLPLAWRPVEFVIGTFMKAERRTFKTEKDHLDEEAQKIIKEQERVREVLFGNDTAVGDALRYREGVVIPSSYKSVKDKPVGESNVAGK